MRRPPLSIRLFGLLLASVFVGCGAPPAPIHVAAAAAPAPTSAAVDEACTLETPLVPGIPGSPGHLIPTAINPDGQSELSVLMRDMQNDLTRARQAITAGQAVPKMAASHRRLRCAWPTTPSDRNSAYDAYAQAYLAHVGALEAAPPAEVAPAFDATLNACKSCHQQSCPGPIAAIEALRLPR